LASVAAIATKSREFQGHVDWNVTVFGCVSCFFD
jgi:hypothetical protein